jgi:hypothetical protein
MAAYNNKLLTSNWQLTVGALGIRRFLVAPFTLVSVLTSNGPVQFSTMPTDVLYF